MEFEYDRLFTVKEFAQLLNTTRATLVHYDDLGILKPAVVADNGYRYYRSDQAQTYLVILLFSECGLTLKDIKGYLETFDEKQGKRLVDEALAMVQDKLRRLSQVERLMNSKRSLSEVSLSHEYDVPFIERFQETRYFRSTMRGMPALQQQLQTDHSISICRYVVDHGEFPEYPFAACMELTPCPDGIEATVFTGQDRNAEIYVKPAGLYACILRRGITGNVEGVLEELANFIQEKGYRIAGDLYMVDTVNFVITGNEEEYSTLYQVRIEQEEG